MNYFKGRDSIYPYLYIEKRIKVKNIIYLNVLMNGIKFGKATRTEINNLICPKLPANMSEKNKNNRVRYIIS